MVASMTRIAARGFQKRCRIGEQLEQVLQEGAGRGLKRPGDDTNWKFDQQELPEEKEEKRENKKIDQKLGRERSGTGSFFWFF